MQASSLLLFLPHSPRLSPLSLSRWPNNPRATQRSVENVTYFLLLAKGKHCDTHSHTRTHTYRDTCTTCVWVVYEQLQHKFKYITADCERFIDNVTLRNNNKNEAEPKEMQSQQEAKSSRDLSTPLSPLPNPRGDLDKRALCWRVC